MFWSRDNATTMMGERKQLDHKSSKNVPSLVSSIFDDGTLATIAGVPQIHFHREAPSLEEAIGSALVNVRKTGFDVVRVEIEPKVVAQGTQVFQAKQQLHGTTT